MAGLENLDAKPVMRPQLAVVGAGWAGLAAAVELIDWADVTIFDAGRNPGGRARCVPSATAGELTQDNGQHILLGAYEHCLMMMRKVGVEPEAVLQRLPLSWWRQGGLQMRCPNWPAPWHLLAGIFGATGIKYAERWQLISALAQIKKQPIAPETTVAQWLRQQRQSAWLVREFWQPLVVSAMNTPIEQASMQVLAQVLQDSLNHKAENSHLLLPKVGLSELFPDAAWRWLAQQGATLISGCRVAAIQPDAQGGIRIHNKRFDAAVLAVAPYHVSALLQDEALAQQVKPYQYWPIYTVYLQFNRPVQLPAILCSRSGGTADWLFDLQALMGRPGQISAVMSAQPALAELSQHSLIERVIQDVRALDQQAGQIIASKVIIDKRATLACQVNLARPALKRPDLPVYLAGDWMYTAYQATLESAVRSGIIAAQHLKHNCFRTVNKFKGPT